MDVKSHICYSLTAHLNTIRRHIINLPGNWIYVQAILPILQSKHQADKKTQSLVEYIYLTAINMMTYKWNIHTFLSRTYRYWL